MKWRMMITDDLVSETLKIMGNLLPNLCRKEIMECKTIFFATLNITQCKTWSMLFQEMVASCDLYVLLPLDEIKVFAPNLNSGKSNELRKFVYQSCFFQSLFPLIVHFFSQLFQRLPQLCLCFCFSCSNLYSTIINNKIGLFCHQPQLSMCI